MISFFLAIGAFFRGIWRGLKDPQFRAMFITVLALLLVGTLFYMRWEQWPWYNALYFCVATLTTIGYGDLVPTHPGTKIFTIFYIFIGIGILLAFINKVASSAFAARKAQAKPEEGNKKAM
jgi:voltage-gated potassium channel